MPTLGPGLPDPPGPGYADTLRDLHRLAVYVVSPAQRLANGEIVLHASPGGFSTFEFGGRTVAVDGGELVVDGARTPITTLRAAAAAAGIEPDVGQQDAFDVPPHGDLDAPLALDPAAVAVVAGWYAFATAALEALHAEAADDDPGPVWLWPEHFDVALDLGAEAAGRRATYGASPGDRHEPEPYLYVSPWAGRVDPFFDHPGFKGAALPLAALRRRGRDAALGFFQEARRRISTAG